MIDIRERQITIDGRPRLILAGEIHYFRLRPEEWEHRIVQLREAGGNAVASYIPWLLHELPDGSFDVEGRTRPNLDVGGFIDLCHRHGLFFIARPGPFVMAELKNEGVPYRLYTDHPEIVPVTWNGAPVPTRTLDYSAPAFLEECRMWYARVIPVLASRQPQAGGNVIALQLDNEVGMLSWVTNSPDLTGQVLGDLRDWLVERDGASAVEAAYGIPPDNLAAFATAVRAPAEAIAGTLLRDLGWFMRERFARYIARLRAYAEEFGIAGIPFLVNIHGTEGLRGSSFPIGISQLARSYTQAPGYLAGSDHYLGDLTRNNAADLYLMNAFMEAVNRPEQPLTALEFEAGEGNYGQALDDLTDPSAADFKLRLSVVQGNRLINYYLFAGGINARMGIETGDGNDRIAFTGERHGVHAPIDPEGRASSTLPRLARTTRMLGAWEDKVAAAHEERDGVVMGFIPDYFMSESIYPGSALMTGLEENLRLHRFGGPDTVLARAMLHLGWRYGALNIQDEPLEVADVPVLALAPARYMAAGLQEKLATWLRAGGRLLAHGELPRFDMTGEPCDTLVQALGLEYLATRWETPSYHPALVAEGWAAPRPDLQARFAQTFAPVAGETLLRLHGTAEGCGFDLVAGQGQAIVLATAFQVDLGLFGGVPAARGGAGAGPRPSVARDFPQLGGDRGRGAVRPRPEPGWLRQGGAPARAGHAALRGPPGDAAPARRPDAAAERRAR